MRSQTKPSAQALSRDERVAHFRVVRLLKRGGMGEVYLARDMRLGRRVALKLLGSGRVGTQAAREHLLAEARATARFNHPHIVTIFHVGLHNGMPYLALEYLEGDTLRDRLNEERLGAPEVVRIGVAIAQAVREAHRHGVCHRDLKPENIVLPTDGRLRVLDFGLAVQDAPLPTLASTGNGDGMTIRDPGITIREETERGSDEVIWGSPQYLAPEIWRREGGAAPADIWALGVILYELASGVRPYSDLEGSELYHEVTGPWPAPDMPVRSELPSGLSELIGACLQKDPSLRPDSGEVVEALEGMLHGARRAATAEQSPFPGLRPFDEDHAEVFFGRDVELAEFLERLRGEPMLPVIGPSGAGKSSFVKAGVIPRLREGGAWRVLSLRPGTQPFEALAARLLELEQELDPSELPTEAVQFRQGGWMGTSPGEGDAAAPLGHSGGGALSGDEPEGDIAALARELREAPGRLALYLGDIARWGGFRLLLFVDQMEEVYTLVEDEETRERFMWALCTAAEDPGEPVRMVFTLRDDFLGRVAQGAQTRRLLSRMMLIRSPASDALREILERPLAEAGYRWESPALVDQMVEDVREELTSLPLLQFATRTLWDRRDRDRRVLLQEVYDRMGGVAGALAEHADAVLEQLSPGQSRVARQILLRLVTPESTRRVVARGRLIEELGEGAEEVLGRLVRARLLSVRRSELVEAPEEAEVELVHESLIAAWGRLARWIAEGRDELAFQAEVEQAARLWDRRGRRADETWRGDALREAGRWLERSTLRLSPLVSQFVQAGTRREARIRRNRIARRRLVMLGLALVTLVALAVTWQIYRKNQVARRQERVAQRQRKRALEQQQRAEQRHAEAQREGARAALARGALLEARAKLRVSLETLDSPLARALWWRMERQPLLWRKNLGSTVYSVEFTPDGRTIAAGCQDGSIYLIDSRTLEVRFLRGHQDQVFSLSFSADGSRLLSGTWNGEVRLWDLAKGTSVGWRAHKALVWGVTFSPDGKELVTSAYDGSVRFWRADGGHRLLRELKTGSRGNDVAISPDGAVLVSVHRDGTVNAWDARRGRRLWRVRLAGLGLASVAYSPDGRVLATGGLDATVRLLEARTGKELRVLRGHRSALAQVVFSHDGRLLASAGQDRVVRLWNPETGALVRSLRGHTGEVRGLGFAPDGRSLVSGSYDKSVRLWRLGSDAPVLAHRGHTALTYGVAFSPRAALVASGGFDGTVRLWDVHSGGQRKVIKVPSSVMGIDYSPDGATIAAGCTDGAVRLLSVASGLETRVLRGHKSRVLSVSFSPDGSRLISGSYDRTVRLWRLPSGELEAVLRGQRGAIHGLAFDRRGARIASASRDGTIWVWDAASHKVLRVLRGHRDDVYGVTFDSASDTLYSTGSGGELRRWDLQTGVSRLLSRVKARAYFLDSYRSPSGELAIGVPGSDQLARIWSAPWQSPVLLRGHRGEVNVLRFGPRGRLVATTSDDSTVRLWDASTGRPYWRAPVLFGEGASLFSHRGWQALLPNSAGSPASGVSGRSHLRRAIEQRARLASINPVTGFGCLRTHDDHLELWSAKRDRRLLIRRVDRLQEVWALPSACLTLARGSDPTSGGLAQIHPRTGSALVLSRRADAVGWSSGRILVAARSQVHLFDPSGAPLASYPAPLGVRALALIGRWVVLGNRDGNIEMQPTDSGLSRPHFTFEDVPSSPVVGMLAGPMSTLVAGFSNGLLGLWSLANGSRLFATRMHGPVRHLRRLRGHLVAATELGDHLVLDLRVFDRPYCDLLREIWRRVPVVWRGGLPAPAAPPRFHRCSPGQPQR